MLAFLLKLHFHLLRTYLIHMMVSWGSNTWTTFKVKYCFYLRNSLYTGPWPHTELLPITKGATMWRPGGPRGISILEMLRATHTCSKARSLIGGDRSTSSPIRLSSRERTPQNPNFIWGRGRCLKMFWCDDILAVQRYVTFLRDEY